MWKVMRWVVQVLVLVAALWWALSLVCDWLSREQ